MLAYRCISAMNNSHLKIVFGLLLVVSILSHALLLYRNAGNQHQPISLGSNTTQTVQKLVVVAERLAKLSRLANSLDELKTISTSFVEISNTIDTVLDSVDTCSIASSSKPAGNGGNVCDETALLKSVTVVFNFVHSTSNSQLIDTILHSVLQLYPSSTVLAGTSRGVNLANRSKIKILHYNAQSYSESDVWRDLVARVYTPYVYLARDVVHVSNTTQLPSLILSLIRNRGSVAGSSTRTMSAGQWSSGCQQSILSNFTLVYEDGYDISLGSCMVCKYVGGAFLTTTQLINQVTLLRGVNSVSAFAHWFQELSSQNRIILSCPESMAYLDDDRAALATKRDQWLPLVKHYQIESLYLSDGTHFIYNCEEARTHCNLEQPAGLARSHCCLRELSAAVRLVLRECKAAGIACEISDGTLLGAVKFEGILPWEVDADITIEPANFTVFGTLVAPLIEKQGYKFIPTVTETIKVYEFATPSGAWIVEVYPMATPDTRLMQEHGLTPTTILMDGEHIQAPESPGLFGRNRYGNEIYQHANHWRANGEDSGFNFYTAGRFASCPKPGNHACLDQYVADGNIHFAKPFI